jgi:predicted RNA-binding Zn ribbon-like protein
VTSAPIPELIGGHLALDLVNTVSWRRDDERRRDSLPDFPALARWCYRVGLLDDARAHEQLRAASDHPGLAQHAWRDARVLREHLHELLTPLVDDSESPDAIVTPPALHNLLVDALARSALIGVPMRWQLTANRPTDLPPLLALHVLDLLQTPQLHVVRRCQDDSCGWLFLDRTRNHTRRWCSSADCGNRDRARRHYARHRDQTSHKRRTIGSQ